MGSTLFERRTIYSRRGLRNAVHPCFSWSGGGKAPIIQRSMSTDRGAVDFDDSEEWRPGQHPTWNRLRSPSAGRFPSRKLGSSSPTLFIRTCSQAQAWFLACNSATIKPTPNGLCPSAATKVGDLVRKHGRLLRAVTIMQHTASTTRLTIVTVLAALESSGLPFDTVGALPSAPSGTLPFYSRRISEDSHSSSKCRFSKRRVFGYNGPFIS